MRLQSLLLVLALGGAAHAAAPVALGAGTVDAKTNFRQLKGLSIGPFSKIAFWRDHSQRTPGVVDGIHTLMRHMKAENIPGEDIWQVSLAGGRLALKSNGNVVSAFASRPGDGFPVIRRMTTKRVQGLQAPAVAHEIVSLAERVRSGKSVRLVFGLPPANDPD
jgi:hypothetical protein